MLIIGRVKEKRTKKEDHNQAISSQDIRRVPQSHSIVSIPSRRHSQKPFVHGKTSLVIKYG